MAANPFDAWWVEIDGWGKEAYQLAKLAWDAAIASMEAQPPAPNNASQSITVWRWEDAPPKYRDLSTHGGDEDWVAFVPTSLKNEYIGWAESGTSFGCCSVSTHDVVGGRILIGSHS